MNLSDFDYRLPPELIAQRPLAERGASRMLVVDRKSGSWRDLAFRDLPSFLATGDCLVLNDSRVLPCRLLGRLPSGGEAEILLLRPQDQEKREWTALARPGKRLRPGAFVVISNELRIEIIETSERGERKVRLSGEGSPEDLLERYGHMPLPPYIHRSDGEGDRARYQTVYADRPGSAAAPTAGLHFTTQILDECRTAGATVARVTLHVGLGTFQPLGSDTVEQNTLHSEWFEIGEAAAGALRSARRRIAVGTTAVRTLETAVRRGGLIAQHGETGIFLYPGCEFRVVDAMLTNFHLPKSSLVLLVAAFAGKDLTLAAYRHAVREKYRFFSYGDCMLIL